MLRSIAVLLGSMIVLAGAGCGSSVPSNANSNSNSNANMAIRMDPANMPPGLSTSPLPPSASMPPGIPANGTVLPVGKTPTPGIPSAEQIKKGIKSGLTPTPGIPDPATLRKQLGLPATNVNMPPPSNGSQMMMKSNRK